MIEELMMKNLAILFFINAIILTPNTLLAQDNMAQEASETVNLVDKDFVSGKEIAYVQGYVEGKDVSCKWWHWCWYVGKSVPSTWVHLYIRGNNGQGGETWIKVGKSKTDKNGYYSFSNLKDYCGPVQVKVPAMKHPSIVDYHRDCGLLDSGRELDVIGKILK